MATHETSRLWSNLCIHSDDLVGLPAVLLLVQASIELADDPIGPFSPNSSVHRAVYYCT